MLLRIRWISLLVVAAAALAIMSASAFADAPVVKTVRVLASNPAVPHDIVSGVATRVKGTSNVYGANIQYTWSFGDGSANVTGTVTSSNYYALEATHTYTGAAGSAFVARLTVTNTDTGESAFSTYNLVIEPDVLATRVNIAIDEGLWYLHKTMTRTASGAVPIGYWTSSSNAGSGYYSNDAANVNAFEVNGFLQAGPAEDPYTETVSRGLNALFLRISTYAIGLQTNPLGTFNPDANGNGLGIYVSSQSYPFYQGGPVVDAIVASGTPNAIAPLGGANIIGRTYKDIVQDMVDYFAWGQYDSSPVGGGWRYSANEWPDNSVCQWVAIGIIAAERQWGVIVNPIVKNWNAVWTTYSQHASGYFGYTDTSPVWGPYATTPSGMVQLVMQGVGRGSMAWDRAETFMRNNFGNTGGASNSVKDYYYGLFSFTKSMLLHDSNGDGVAEPITMLQSSTAGVNPIDWYAAEVSKGDPTDGVARTLVNDQDVAGYWYGHNYSSTQYRFETAWAIIMLRRTVVELPPIAIADATPNPVLAGMVVNFNGAASYSTNPVRSIVKWEWDLDNNGTFETLGVTASRTFPADGDYPVTLRVTDNGASPLTDTDTIIIAVRQPPVAPTANAGGPYNLCMNKTPWFLNGSGSVNPDEGISEPGQPGNTIIEYAWELDGDNDFNDAYGVTPNITGLLGVGAYLIQLRVTDNSAASHPSYPIGGTPANLSDTDSAPLNIRAATDPLCSTSCVSDLTARAKPTKVDLVWTWRTGAHHYNVYRGTISGGPYMLIGEVSAPSLIGGISKGVYADLGLVNGTTYYYVVREAAANNDEFCQSNQASARPTAR